MQLRQVLVLLAGLGCAYSMPPPESIEVTTFRPVRTQLSYPAALRGASTQGIAPSRMRGPLQRKEMPTARPMTKMYASKPSNAVPTYSASQGLFTPFIQPANLHVQEPVSNHVENEVQEGKDDGDYYQHSLQDHDAKYEFVYRVQDHEYKPIIDSHGQEVLGTGVPSDYGHSEARSGEKTWGRYFVKLPDGRVQTVRYWADHTGYHAEVLFTGEAQHPKSYNNHYTSLHTTHTVAHDPHSLGGHEHDEYSAKGTKNRLVPSYENNSKLKYQPISHDAPSSEDDDESEEESEQTQQVDTTVKAEQS